jgi:hypothetical protein
VRVFTREEARVAEQSVQDAFHEQVVEAASQGKSGVDVSTLPPAEQQSQHVGKEGEVKMFRKGEKAFAYQWSGPSRSAAHT